MKKNHCFMKKSYGNFCMLQVFNGAACRVLFHLKVPQFKKFTAVLKLSFSFYYQCNLCLTCYSYLTYCTLKVYKEIPS